MKKVSILILVSMVVLMLCAHGAEAQNVHIGLHYVYTDNIYAALSFSGSTAIASGSIEAVANNRKTNIYVELQRDTDEGWKKAASWSDSGGSSASAGGNHSAISGQSYRVYAIGRIYDLDGNLLETATKYSSAKTCP